MIKIETTSKNTKEKPIEERRDVKRKVAQNSPREVQTFA